MLLIHFAFQSSTQESKCLSVKMSDKYSDGLGSESELDLDFLSVYLFLSLMVLPSLLMSAYCHVVQKT